MSKPVIFALGPEFLTRDGLTETIQPWEDGLRAATGRGAFEWWYFDAHLDDGSTAVIVFYTKSLINPSDPLHPTTSLTITRPDGEKLAEYAFSPAGEFAAAQEQCDVRSGPNWVKWSLQDGRWRYTLHAETGALSADLTFTGLVPPWRPGAGKIFFGDLTRYFAWLPAIPYGTVAGNLKYDGQTHPVTGSGYHDHNWGNVALPAVMDHWTWGRAHLGPYTLIFVEQIAARKYGFTRMPVFLLAQGERVLADNARHLTMRSAQPLQHASRHVYPSQIDFIWACEGETVHLALRQAQVIEAVSLLTALPPLKRALARLLVNPYYFRFRAEMELSIDLGGLQTVTRGPALYEMMLLR